MRLEWLLPDSVLLLNYFLTRTLTHSVARFDILNPEPHPMSYMPLMHWCTPLDMVVIPFHIEACLPVQSFRQVCLFEMNFPGQGLFCDRGIKILTYLAELMMYFRHLFWAIYILNTIVTLDLESSKSCTWGFQPAPFQSLIWFILGEVQWSNSAVYSKIKHQAKIVWMA